MTPSVVSDTGPTAMPIWLDWLLTQTQMGFLVLDGDAKLVFANKWLLTRAALEMEQVVGHRLLDVFPVLVGSHFARALKQSMQSGFPSILSQTLHPAPFPLYANAAQRERGVRLHQSIQIVPMGPQAAAAAGQRFILVQITDVSATVFREGLLKARVDRMSDMAHSDVLTGVGNRRAFDQSLESEVRATVRARKPLGLLMLDIDHFKRFNDRYGHPAGDRCIRAVVDVVRQICRRPRDLVARYGGEELAVILPETDWAGTLRVANDILEALRKLRLPHEGNPCGPIVTLSAGASVLVAGADSTAATLLRQADMALYAAKSAGRDRVVQFDPEIHTVHAV